MSKANQQLSNPKSASQTVSAPTTKTTSAEGSNAVAAQEARSPEGTAAGLESYQASLGQWLGTELYEAVAPILTLERMSSTANKALLGAFGSAMGALENLDPAHNKKDIKKFSAAFKKEFGTAAGDWLKEDGADLAGGLADWVDANPELLVTAALLAAAGAYLADASIPELTSVFGIGEDLSVKLGVELGTFQNIALEEISAQLSHATAPLVAAIKVKQNGENTETEFSASYGEAERKLSVDGKMVGEDLSLFAVKGLTTFDQNTLSGGYTRKDDTEKFNVDLQTKDGKDTKLTGVDYDPSSGTITLRNVLEHVDGDSKSKLESSMSTDGSHETALSLSESLSAGLMGTISLSAGAKYMGENDPYGLKDTQKVALGLNYDTKDLDAMLKLSGNSDSDYQASGGVDYKFGEGYEAGFDAKRRWGTNEDHEVGAYFGFRNADEFETYMAKYRFKSEDGGSHFGSLMVEKEIGVIKTRLTQTLNHSAKNTDWSTTGEGAYFFNKNVAMIAGAKYSGDKFGESSISPLIGAQIHGIPLIVSHDFKTGSTALAITLKFDF
jgi:hypothetical protein